MKITPVSTLGIIAFAALAPGVAQGRGGADDAAHHSVAARHGGATAKRVAGTCSRSSSSKLKVKADNGRLETEFEVDTNRNGVRWTVALRRNGRLATRRKATTHAPSGSFSFNRRLGNGPGRDTVSARAVSPSGEVCSARLVY